MGEGALGIRVGDNGVTTLLKISALLLQWLGMGVKMGAGVGCWVKGLGVKIIFLI